MITLNTIRYHASTKQRFFISSLILATIITACSDDSPPIKQPTVINNYAAGIVSLGSIRNGEVRVYEIGQSHCDTTELRLIDSQRLEADGQFNLTLDIEQGLVLYQLRDATYTEEASGETVAMTKEQSLMAIASYDASQPQPITISSWSHLHTGLSCWLIKTTDEDQALQQATDFIVSLLGFDPLVIKGRLITDPNNNRLDVVFDETMKLGFMNAALSQMSMKLSKQLEFVEHHVIHSVYMAQLFYQDIYHDGILNGRGARGKLHIPGEDQAHIINTATYRLSLPHSLLEFYDTNAHNQVTKGRGQLLSMALTINANQHPQVFSNQPSPIDLDSAPPHVSWLSDKLLNGEVNISLRINDFSGIDEVAFYAPGRSVNITATERDGIFMVHLDTRLDGSRETIYRVEANDILGNSKTYSFPVDLINQPPDLRIISADHSSNSNYELRAEYSPVNRRQRVVHGECVLDEVLIPAKISTNPNRLSCPLSLTTSGDSNVTVRICDSYQLCSQQQHLIVYDSHPPQIDVVDEQPVYHGNISLIFEVFDNITGLQLPVEWQAHINQQFIPIQVQLLDGNRYGIFIDTDFFGSNEVEIAIRARDMLNNTKRYTGTYQVVNPLPTIDMVSDPWFNGDSHTLAFRVTEQSSLNITTSCQGINNEILVFAWGSYKNEIGRCHLILPDSNEGIYLVSIEICGNYKLCTTYITNITKDTTGPVITLNDLPIETNDNTIRVAISANDEHAPVRSLTYQLDEMMEQSVHDNMVLLDNLTTGNHKLVVRAWDTLGNPTEVIRQFLVLYDKPIITMTSPELTNDGSYDLRVLIDPGTYQGDYEGQCHVGDNKPVVASIGNRTLHCELDMENLDDGKHDIRVLLTADYDKSYEHRVMITKDTQPPEIDLTNVADTYASSAIPIIIGIADRLSSVIRPTYRIDEGIPLTLNPQGNSWQLLLPVNQLVTGQHSLTIQADDVLGNRVEKEHQFLVLKDEPRLVATSPAITKQHSYSLTARILKGTYQGSYEILCQLGDTIITAAVTDDRLSCQLDIESLADGNHTIAVELTANYGRSYIRQVSIIKDTQPPQVSWLNLADSYSNGTLPLYIAIRDTHAGVTEAFYSLNRQVKKPLTKQAGDEWSLLLAVEELPTGRHTIGIHALDRAGHQIDTEKSFLVLKEQPQLRLTSPAATSSDAWTLIATIDAGSYEGIYRGICQLGHQQIPAQIIIRNQEHLLSCALDLTSLDDGQHQVNIQLTTDYGISYQRTVSIIKDTQPPRLDLTDIAAEFHAGAVPIEIEISDRHSSIATATYRLNDAIPIPLTQQAQGWGLILGIDQLSTGRHSLTITATDQLGNQISRTRSFLVLKDEPSIGRTSNPYTKHQAYTLRAAINPFSYQGDYQGYCQLAGERVTAFIENDILSCPFNLVNMADGNHSVNIELQTDYQTTYHRQLSFIKDTQPPQVNWLNLADSYSNGTFPLYMAINDVYTGVGDVSYRLNQQAKKPLTKQAGDEWSLILAVDELPTGRHTVTIRALDRAGNEMETEQSLLILREQPQLRLTSSAATSSNIWTLIATIDAGSYEGSYQGSCRLGHQQITAQIIVRNREHLLSCILDFSGLDDGEHQISTLLTTDYGISYERTVEVIKDTQPPQLDLTNIAAEFYSGAIPIRIGITDSHSSIATATYSLNDATSLPLTRQAQRWGLILGVDQLSTGRHSLTIVATDQLGNSISQTRSFLVLKDEPSIGRTSNLYTKHQAYRLRANINPFSYQGNYQGYCQLAGERVTAFIENNILSCPFDIVDLVDGNHSISIQLRTDYDKTYQHHLLFIKDTQPPQVRWLNLANSYSNGTFPLYVAINDKYAGVREASYRLNQQPEKPLTKGAGDEWSLILATGELPTGRHTVRIRTLDKANNQVEIEQSLLILREQPQLRLTSPAATSNNVWTLIAIIDAGSYESSYEASCQLGYQRIVAQMIVRNSEHLLSCVLDLTGLDDGEHEISILLTTDYGINYERTVSVIKDTQSPQLDLNDVAAEFYAGAIPLRIGISDRHSSIATATYSLNDAIPISLTQQAQGWGFILGVDQLSTGRHSLTITASDQLGNSISQTRSFLVLKDEPSIIRTSDARTKHQAYTLRADINPFSYQGDYQGYCQLAGERVAAFIQNNILSCPLNIVALADGNHTISIELGTDYQKAYRHRLSFIKDTQPPTISAYNHRAVYTDSSVQLEFRVTDVLSSVSSVMYQVDSTWQSARYLGNGYWTVDLVLTEDGMHSVSLIAQDSLGQQRQQDFTVLVVTNPPQLDFTHPQLSRDTHMDITGNITLATPLAPVAYIDCLVDGETPIRARIMGSTFTCHSYNIENYNRASISVKVCDTHANCAIFQTDVSQDARPPQIDIVLPVEQLSYAESCLPHNNYDNITLDCTTQLRARSELWQLVEPNTNGPSLSPVPFIFYQNTTRIIDGHLMDHDSLADAEIGYITIKAADSSRSGSYLTQPQNLNISYSYTQLDCESDSISHCSTEHHHPYFVNRPLVPHSYHNDRAIITIPFTDEFLSHADKPLWYLASTNTIHRLDISICDEAGNCISRVARFRIKLFATQPQIKAGVRDNFIKLLRQSQYYSQVFSLPVAAARYWEIINPSDYPIWITIGEISDVTVRYRYLHIRKENKYRKHKIRQFTHSSYLPGDASCGRRPFPDRSRRSKYRIYRQYLSDNWITAYDDPSDDRGGAYGSHGHQWSVRDSCSGVTDSIVESRYEIRSGYPRIRSTTIINPPTYSFIYSLKYYNINNQGELRTAYPQGQFYRIAAKGKLIVQSSELLQGTPSEPTDRQAIYDYWRRVNDERTITIPLSLNIAFTASRFNQRGIAEPDSHSLRYIESTTATQRFIRRLPIYCQETCGAQRLTDTWQQLNP